MKISKVVALSLTMASAHTLAFQAKEMTDKGYLEHQIKKAEYRIISNFDSQHNIQSQMTVLGTCAAVSVPGCNCPFCAMLRGGNV